MTATSTSTTDGRRRPARPPTCRSPSCSATGRPPWVERVAPVPVAPPEAIAILGFRDPTELDDLRDELATNRRAGVLAVDADTIRRNGPATVAADALDHVRQAADKVWLHIDLDVLDELVFPATDYLIPDGLELGRADRPRPPGRDRPGSHRLVAVVLQPGEGSGWRPRAGHRRRDRAAVRDLTRPIPPGPISSGPDGQAGPSAVHPVRTMRHGLDDDLLVGSSAGAIQEERDMTHETKDEPVVVVAATAGDEAGITAEGVLAVQGNEAVLVAQFADMNAAEAAYEALRDAEINGQIDIDGVLVVNADLDGKIRVKRMSDHTSRNGFLWGAVAGAALAVIFPPSLLAGLVAGGVVGGAVGKVGNQLKKGQVAAELATVITPGTSGIVAVVDITAVDAVKKTIPESKKVEAVPVDKRDRGCGQGGSRRGRRRLGQGGRCRRADATGPGSAGWAGPAADGTGPRGRVPSGSRARTKEEPRPVGAWVRGVGDWLRGTDSNRRPSGYEPDELPLLHPATYNSSVRGPESSTDGGMRSGVLPPPRRVIARIGPAPIARPIARDAARRRRTSRTAAGCRPRRAGRRRATRR